MPVFVIGLIALMIFGVIGLMLFTASTFERSGRKPKIAHTIPGAPPPSRK